MTVTTNLKLPCIDPNQNQKSVTHNSALTMLDAIVHPAILASDLANPPANPAEGQAFIVAPGGTGAWAGKDLAIAAWQNGAWAFYTPGPGWTAYVVALGSLRVFSGTAWVSVVPATLQLSALAVGTAPDPNNPLSAKLNRALLSSLAPGEGGTGDVRLSLSKSAPGNAASVLFQDNFAGRAEIGLCGDDNLRLRVSPDWATFTDALVVAPASATVAFPAAPTAPTAPVADNSTRLATTAYADRAAAANFQRTAVADAAYAMTAADRAVAVTALTAPRILTLPPAAAYPSGVALTVLDESGACSGLQTLTLQRSGSDTVGGQAQLVLAAPYAAAVLRSNGADRWTLVGQAGASAPPPFPQGRLTLASGTPVLTAGIAGSGLVFYTPASGNQIPLWSGTAFVPASFGELVNVVSSGGGTAGPAAAATNSVYDLFVWMCAAGPCLTRGPAWSAGTTRGSNTMRGAGAGSTALTRVAGLLVNQYAIVNGPAAGFGTYVGTIATDASAATSPSRWGRRRRAAAPRCWAYGTCTGG